MTVRMTVDIRPASPEDHEGIVALTLRAWAPVYPAVNAVLGPELAGLLHGDDWREHQEREVREALVSPSMRVWVAEVGGALAGFVAARVIDPERAIGEVYIVGVDPAAQRSGVGSALTRHAAGWLREQGMRVAVVSTGGDPGHAPARALYERLGYRPLPGVQYFAALDGDTAGPLPDKG